MSELKQIKDDLQSAINSLTTTAKRLKQSAADAVTARCDYENLKNQYLLELKAEESDDPKIKRTDAIRTAMYRALYKEERKAYLAAEADYESDKDLFRGLQAKLNALQSIARLTETEIKYGTTVEDRFNNLEAQINEFKYESRSQIQ
jgi:uncharacterized Ntn-hydrolase superfamily protein